MLYVSIAAGVIMGGIYEAGERGWIPSWGSGRRDFGAWGNLAMLGIALAFIATRVETGRGFVVVSLVWLGAFKLAQMVIKALLRERSGTS